MKTKKLQISVDEAASEMVWTTVEPGRWDCKCRSGDWMVVRDADTRWQLSWGSPLYRVGYPGDDQDFHQIEGQFRDSYQTLISFDSAKDVAAGWHQWFLNYNDLPLLPWNRQPLQTVEVDF
jgi:hypothetical protein